MNNRFLYLVAALLVVLLVLSRTSAQVEVVQPIDQPPTAADESILPYNPAPVTRPPRVAPIPVQGVPEGRSATPVVDRLAILAVRRRIAREGTRVYLDSLWSQTDSTVVRWPDRGGQPLTVVFVPDSTLEGWNDSFLVVARSGMAAWSGNSARIRFVETETPEGADVRVSFVNSVSGAGEFGVTELSWSSNGQATHANINLALRPESGSPVVPPNVMRRVAIHEFGHALGLPHSDNRSDIMFSSSPVSAPSRRDQATLQLLYAVPSGTLHTP